MNKNNVIFLLSVLLISLILTFISKYYIYPISVNFSKSSIYKRDWILSNLDKTSVENPFFFDIDVPIGMERYEMLKKDTILSVIRHNGQSLDADIKYYYNSSSLSGKVVGVHLTFPYAYDIENEINTYYGKKYIKARRKTSYDKRKFKIWCTDNFVVILEHKNEKLYMSIKEIGFGWKQSAAYGAYVNDTHLKEDVNCDELTQLSFQGITLGKHINQTEQELNNNPNVISYTKISEHEYKGVLTLHMPNQVILNLHTWLTFYKDTLTEIRFSSEEATVDLMALYKRKYEISDSLIHQNVGEWKNYKRDVRFYFDWKSRNQTLSVHNSIEEHSSLGIQSDEVFVSYRQSALYESLMEEKEIQSYTRSKEELKRKEQEAKERELKLQQEIASALDQI